MAFEDRLHQAEEITHVESTTVLTADVQTSQSTTLPGSSGSAEGCACKQPREEDVASQHHKPAKVIKCMKPARVSWQALRVWVPTSSVLTWVRQTCCCYCMLPV